MKTTFMKTAALAGVLLASLLAWSGAQAQTFCSALIYKSVLTTGQWQNCFQQKQDLLGYTAVNKAGDTMLGRLTFAPSTTVNAGINLGVGVAPTTPGNGDFWLDVSGLHYRLGGVTFLAGVGTGSNTWVALQQFTDNDFALLGSTSGSLKLRAPAVAGTSSIRFPAGTTDFSATGGTSQFVRQNAAGGALDVVRPAASDLSNGTTGSGNVVLATGGSISAASLTATQSVVFSGRVDSTIAADQNDWTPSGTGTYSQSSAVFVNGGVADRNITGLTGGAAGRFLWVVNNGTTNAIVLKNQSGSSSAANRFLFGSDVSIAPNTTVGLRYDGTALNWRCESQCLTSASGNAPISNSLSGDVTLNSSTYTDGPSIAQGTTGTWLATGTVTLVDSAAAQGYNCKLWDGTTIIASARMVQSIAGNNVVVSLSGVLTAPAANIRISCLLGTNDATSKMVFNASGNSKDSTLTAILLH